MENKKFIKNILYNFSYQLLLIIVPLITTPYISRILGAEKIGEYSFAQSIISYFVLVGVLGTTLYGQRTIAEVKDNENKRSKLFIEIFILRFVLVCTVFLTYILGVVNNVTNKSLYLLVALELVSVVFDISWFFQGMELFQSITLYNGCCKIAGTLAVFCFVKNPLDLNVYVFLYGFSLLLGHILSWIEVKKHIKIQKIKIGSIKIHISGSVRLFISQFAIQLYTVLDKTMIGVITDSNLQNGYYEQSQKIIRVLVVIVTAIGTVVASRIAVLWSMKKEDAVRELINTSFRIGFTVSLPLCFGTYLLAPIFVPFYYGTGYEPVVDLIKILSLLLPVISCSNIIGLQLFVPIKKEKWLTYSVCGGACVNVVLNLFLIPSYGAVGAAIGSLLAEMSVTGIQIYLARKFIKTRSVITIFTKYLIYTCIMAVPAIIIYKILPASITTMFIEVLICGLIYGGLLLASKDPIFDIFFKK